MDHDVNAVECIRDIVGALKVAGAPLYLFPRAKLTVRRNARPFEYTQLVAVFEQSITDRRTDKAPSSKYETFHGSTGSTRHVDR